MPQHVSLRRTVIIRKHPPTPPEPGDTLPADSRSSSPGRKSKVIAGYIEITVYESLSPALGGRRSRIAHLARLNRQRRDKSPKPIGQPGRTSFATTPLGGSRTTRSHESRTSALNDTARRSSRLDALLQSVLEQPEKWLATPSDHFGGRRPSDLVGTDEEDKIIDLLNAVDQGLF